MGRIGRESTDRRSTGRLQVFPESLHESFFRMEASIGRPEEKEACGWGNPEFGYVQARFFVFYSHVGGMQLID